MINLGFFLRFFVNQAPGFVLRLLAWKQNGPTLKELNGYGSR